MEHLHHSSNAAPVRGHLRAVRSLAVAAAIAGLLASTAPAHAVDGCLVLLCFAAPNWSAIPQCVPPIRQVLRDLARGRPFPTCAMSGPGNSASHRWASVPDNCPPQYTQLIEGESTPFLRCAYTGVISVNVEGSLWSRTWWSFGGDTVTEFMSPAKARLGTWDTRFDEDHAKWFASQPVSTAACPGC